MEGRKHRRTGNLTERKVKICDRCNQVVSNKVCEICDKDICDVCQEDTHIGISIVGGINTLLHIVSCKNCAYKLGNTKLKNYFDDSAHKKIRRDTVKIFKNAMLMSSLEDNDDEKKKQKIRIQKSWTPKKAHKSLIAKNSVGTIISPRFGKGIIQGSISSPTAISKWRKENLMKGGKFTKLK